MRVARHQRRDVGAGSRRRNVGRTPTLRWAGAVGCVGRGGQDSVRLPVSPRPRPPIVVGARPPPRCHCSRPTALAADTAGAAPNLGVVVYAVACRRASRSIVPASGAAEAGVGRPIRRRHRQDAAHASACHAGRGSAQSWAACTRTPDAPPPIAGSDLLRP